MTKRWNPGHYLVVWDDVNRLPMQDSSRNKVRYNPLFKGYWCGYWWFRHETSKNVYDFSAIIGDLDKAASDGKMLIVSPMNRTFHGTSRGPFVPQYLIDEYNGVYYYTEERENFGGPKTWLPAVNERWLLYLEKLCKAIDGHPAFQGIYTEEGAMSGAYLQPGWTVAAANGALLDQVRVGMENCKNGLFFQNGAWSNESTDADRYAYTDTIVNTYYAGCGPNDLSLSSFTKTDATAYGKYVYSRYRGIAPFFIDVEWSSYHNPESPTQLINFAYSLGINFISWQDISGVGSTFDVNDVINAVQATNGLINTVSPTNVTRFDDDTIPINRLPLVSASTWDAKVGNGANAWTPNNLSLPSSNKLRRALHPTVRG